MRSASLLRSTETADVRTLLAAVDRRDRLVDLAPTIVALVAAFGLLVLAFAG